MMLRGIADMVIGRGSSEPQNQLEEKKMKLKGIFEILFGLTIAGAIFFLSDKFVVLEGWGYFGIFAIAFLSSATIFIPAPGWAIVIVMSKILDPFYVGFIAGIGGGLGEIVGYMVGNGAASVTGRNIEKFRKWSDWIKKNDFLAIVIFAAIPNPLFDVAGVAAGMLGVPAWRFLVACVIGRTLRYLVLAYLSAFSLQYL